MTENKYLSGGKLVGGNSGRGRVKNDYYATPTSDVLDFFDKLINRDDEIDIRDFDRILEPAGGGGHIIDALEDVLIFSKGGKKVNYFPIMQERSESGKNRIKTKVNYKTKTEVYAKSLHGEVSSKRPNLRYPSSVQKFNRERGLHPTQKPVELLEYLIKTYTNEDMLVLDNCMGSGSTGVACKNTNRKFIGIELDDEYFNIASKRILDK